MREIVGFGGYTSGRVCFVWVWVRDSDGPKNDVCDVLQTLRRGGSQVDQFPSLEEKRNFHTQKEDKQRTDDERCQQPYQRHLNTMLSLF